MKIRAIRTKDVVCLGTTSFDFQSADIVVIYGDNGSGKSLLVTAMTDSFIPVLGGSTESGLGKGRWSIEFDIGSEVVSVSITNGRIDRSVALKRQVRYDSESKLVENCVLAYGVSRIYGIGRTKHCTGISSIYALMHDLHVREMRDCAIIIDDFDLGLSFENMKLCFEHFRRNFGAKRCQLVLTSRSRLFVDWVMGLGIGVRGIELTGGVDVVKEGIRVIRERE